MSITIGSSITATGYVRVLSTVTSVITTYYGSPQTSQSVVAGNRVRADDWRNLFNDINRGLRHQSNTAMPFANITTGSVLTSQFVNSLTNYANQISNNKTLVHPSQLIADSARSTSTRTSTWGSDIVHEVQYTWNTVADAEYFFNQGGYLFPKVRVAVGSSSNPESITWSSIINATATDISNQPAMYTYGRAYYITNYPGFSYQAAPYSIDVMYTKVDARTIKASMTFNTNDEIGLNINSLPESTFFNYYSTDATGGTLSPRPSILVTTGVDVAGATLYPQLTYNVVSPRTVNQYSNIVVPVQVVNTGTGVCTISNYGFVPQPGSGLSALSITISSQTVQTGTAATLQLTLTGVTQGTFQDNYLEVFSNSINGVVRIPIKVSVIEPVFAVTTTPLSVVATVTSISPVIQHFAFSAGLTGNIYSYGAWVTNNQYFGVTGLPVPGVASLTPSQRTYSDSLFTTFLPPRSNTSGNIVGTYSSVLTVTYMPYDYNQSAVTTNIPITYNVNIENRNLGSWLSPKDEDNAVMGCSFDIIEGVRYMTIGFGMGGDNSPILVDKGSTYASVSTLGIGADPNPAGGIPLSLSARTDFCAFLQEYGSWIAPDGGSGYNSIIDLTYTFSVPVGGTFTYELSSVSTTSISFNGSSQTTASWANPRNSTTGRITLNAGTNTIRIVTSASGTGQQEIEYDADGNPFSNGEPLADAFGSFGVNIKDSNGNSWWSTKHPRRVAYQYWAEVYRIPLPSVTTKTVYLSKNYAVKITDLALGNTYGSWCGTGDTKGSMFLLADDGKGNITISMNPWDSGAYGSTTGSYSLNRTLAYSVSLPFYYSNLGNRITNLESPFKGFMTRFFLGFFKDGRVRLTQQPYPYVYVEPETGGGGGKKKKRSIWANLVTAAVIGGAVYAGLALTVGTTVAILGGLTAVGVSIGVGAAAFLLLAVCFTGDSLVSMADGTFKMIKDVQVGDKVWNYNMTRVNTVTYVEKTLDTVYGQLYSISKDHEPFITINHPMYIDGKLSSVYPDKVYEAYPWLGMTEPLNPDRIIDATGQTVYNLWTDGDHTYIVNGYGTTTINGDGGWGRMLVEQGITTPERLGEVLYECASGGKELSYGAYICDRILAKLDIKIVNKIAGRIMARKDSPLARRAILKLFKGVGKLAVYVTERKLRK